MILQHGNINLQSLSRYVEANTEYPTTTLPFGTSSSTVTVCIAQTLLQLYNPRADLLYLDELRPLILVDRNINKIGL